MELLEPVEQRIEEMIDRTRREPLLPRQAPGEGLALDQGHHHVGGAVVFQEVVDPHDARRPFEPRQGPRLFEETVASPRELLRMIR